MTFLEVLFKGRKSTWLSMPTIVFVIILISSLFFKSKVAELLENFSVGSLISANVAGLALMLPLLTAMLSVLSDDDLGNLFTYYEGHKDDKKDPDKYAFFNTFAPILWIEILFGINALFCLIGSVINLKQTGFFSNGTLGVIKLSSISILILAIFQSMDLLCDTILTRMEKIRLVDEMKNKHKRY